MGPADFIQVAAAVRAECSIKDRPPTLHRFLLGIALLPPRAGMTARTESLFQVMRLRAQRPPPGCDHPSRSTKAKATRSDRQLANSNPVQSCGSRRDGAFRIGRPDLPGC